MLSSQLLILWLATCGRWTIFNLSPNLINTCNSLLDTLGYDEGGHEDVAHDGNIHIPLKTRFKQLIASLDARPRTRPAILDLKRVKGESILPMGDDKTPVQREIVHSSGNVGFQMPVKDASEVTVQHVPDLFSLSFWHTCSSVDYVIICGNGSIALIQRDDKVAHSPLRGKCTVGCSLPIVLHQITTGCGSCLSRLLGQWELD